MFNRLQIDIIIGYSFLCFNFFQAHKRPTYHRLRLSSLIIFENSYVQSIIYEYYGGNKVHNSVCYIRFMN